MSEQDNNSVARKEAESFLKDDLLGRDDFKKSKLGYFTGISPAVGAINSVGKIGVGAGRRIGLAARGAFGKRRVPKLPTDSDDAAVRFEIAQEAYGRSDADIARIEVSTRRVAFVWLFILAALTVWGIYIFPGADENPGLFGYLFPFVAHLFVIPKMIRSLFWAWQVRNRRLAPFHEFMGRPSEWFPSMTARSVSMFAIAVAAGALAFMVPGMAMAQDAGMLTPQNPGALDFLIGADDPDKIFYQLLQVVAPFGPIEPGVVVSPWAVPFSNAAAAFNTTLLALGGAMLGWQTISGMIATAQEGEVLGKRWNTLWAPVRVTAGVGTLVPISGGLAAVQVLILQLALWGSGMADAVWGAYIETFRDRSYMAELLVGSDGETVGRRNYDASLERLIHDVQAQDFMFALVERQACLQGVGRAMELSAHSSYTKGSNVPKDADIPMLSEAEFEAFHRDFTQLAPGLANTVAYQGTSSRLSPIEVITGQPEHNVGLSLDGGRITKGVEKIPAGEGTQMIIRQGGTPVAFWDFGVCGDIQLDFFDIKAIESKIATDPSAFGQKDVWWSVRSLLDSPRAQVLNEGEQVGEGSSYYNTDEGVIQERLEIHKKAYDLIMDSTSVTAQAIESQVMPLTAEVARVLYLSSVAAEREGQGGTRVDFEKTLNDPDGPVLPLLAEAYQKYLDIVSIERAKTAEGVYSLVNYNDAFDGFIDMSQDKGWASAGALYMIIARIQEVNYSIDTVKLKYGGGMTETVQTEVVEGGVGPGQAYKSKELWSAGNMRSDMAEIFDGPNGLKQIFAQFKSKAYHGVKTDPRVVANKFSEFQRGENEFLEGLFPAGDTFDASEAAVDAIQGALASFADTLLEYMLSLEPDPFFALTEMVDFGQAIVTIAILILGLALLGSLASGIFGSVANVVTGGGVSKLLGMVQWVGMMVLALGMVHAYIIPMVPYFMFTFFVIGMLILVAEALIAAPIWAFMHIRMDGQDYVDSVQKPGYMIAFNIVLRPTLAIFGLILSFSVFSAGIWFMNATFGIAARAAMSEGTTMVGVISMFCIMTYMHFQMAMRSFKLITEMPDRVTRWFGQGGEGLSESQDADKTAALFISNSEGRLKEGGSIAAQSRKSAEAGSDTQQTAAGANGGASSPAVKAKGKSGSEA